MATPLLTMPYRLRTLLILLAVGPPIVAWAAALLWWQMAPITIRRTNPDTGEEYVIQLRYTWLGQIEQKVLTPDTMPAEDRAIMTAAPPPR